MQKLINLKNKRIFISGGAGIIGRELVFKLLELNAKIFVGDLKKCPKDFAGKVKYRTGDLNTITKKELINFKPEIFFHLAATYERTYESYNFFSNNFFLNDTKHIKSTCSKSNGIEPLTIIRHQLNKFFDSKQTKHCNKYIFTRTSG